MPAAQKIPHRVDMRSDFDCGVACVAMLTGLDPDAIEAQLGYRPKDTVIPDLCLGLIHEEVILLLHEQGLRPVYVRTREDIDDEFDRYRPDSPHLAYRRTMPFRRLLPDHDGVLDMIRGHRAMLAVRHDTLDYGHFVVWDGDRVLDPHPKRRVEIEGLDEWRIRAAIITWDP